jgi:hypothetical protein
LLLTEDYEFLVTFFFRLAMAALLQSPSFVFTDSFAALAFRGKGESGYRLMVMNAICARIRLANGQWQERARLQHTKLAEYAAKKLRSEKMELERDR